MAVTPISSELVLVVKDGTYSSGATKYKSCYYKNVKPDAAAANVWQTGAVLSRLQTRELGAIQRRDLSQLEQD